ncbi:hypothetical protein QR685DRAFT_587248, partial [Neurospora intermedia]
WWWPGPLGSTRKILNGADFDSSIGPHGARAGADNASQCSKSKVLCLTSARPLWRNQLKSLPQRPDHNKCCEATLQAALLALLAVGEPDTPLNEAAWEIWLDVEPVVSCEREIASGAAGEVDISVIPSEDHQPWKRRN